MRLKLRILASLGPVRLLSLAVLAVALVLSSCVSVLPATQALPGQGATAVEPPPGGLVDSAPNVGWTQGAFSVSQDGAAQYAVPLWVPAGRGAVTPQLSLSYNSRAGNGLLGVGWSLGGLSAISWCGRTIAQDGYTDGGHFDGQDGLCLGGNRLVPISTPYSPVREYRTERETFARITAYETQDNVPDFFRVFTKDGKILTFGGSTRARVQPYLLRASGNLAEPSLRREIAEPRATTAWALDRVEDRNGNVATVEYTRSEGGAPGLWWMEQLPDRIRYAPNRWVKFHYEYHRPDKIDGFSGGTHTRTDALLSRIEMWGGPDGGTAELLRRYNLSYRSNSITGRSLLHSVAECDGDEKCKLSLPFEYSLGSYKFKEVDVGASDPTPVSVVDVNADGRSDLLLRDHGELLLKLRVATKILNDEGFGFAAPLPSGLPATRAFQTLDVDADGRPEVLAEVSDSEQGPGLRYQLYRPTGSSFEAVPDRLGEWRPDFANRQPAYLADLDGSGLPDFVGTAFGADEPWSYRLSIGRNFFGSKVHIHQSNIGIGNFAVDTNGDGRTELLSPVHGAPGWVSWGLSAADGEQNVQKRLLNLRGGPTTTHFGDINGDGLVDSVLPQRLPTDVRDELRVQLNSGNGFGSRLTAPSPPGYRAPPSHGTLEDVGVRVVDFNGDGRDDVLLFHPGRTDLYLWADNAFVRAPLDLNIGEPIGQQWNNTQVLDLDGDGALDLVNAGTDGRLRAFQRLGGVPDQLIGIGDVSSAGRTEISYTTLADRAVHTPGTLFCSYPRNCPISGGSVVASHRVTTDAGTGSGTGTPWDDYRHTYKEARADLHGRGGLGFAEHTVTRVATGATTVTRFDNVVRDPSTRAYPFAHLPEEVTYTVKDVNDATGREFRSTTHNYYNSHLVHSGIYTLEQRRATVAEEERPVGATEWQSLRRSTTETSYDDFGNPDVVRSATANGRTLTQDFDHRNDTAAWLIGLPTRTLTTGCTSTAVCTTRESTFDYDHKGNPTITVVEPNNPALKLTTTTGYGEFGVVTSVTKTDNAGQSRTDTREYNNADLLYPTATINAAGHRTVVDTHSGLGVPIRIRGPNGVPATYRYDGFGRLREINRSDGSFERISYNMIGDRQVTATTVAGGGTTAELVDRLGRTRERRVTAFDGRIATTYTDHDPLGRGVARTSRPALPGETPQYTATRYDNRGRITSITEPDGAEVRHEYVNLETHTYDAKSVHSYALDTVDGQVDSVYEDDPNSTDWLRTRFEYGSFGDTTKIVAPDDTAQTMHYDPLGRRNRLEDPSSGTTVTTYNAFGEPASVTDAENRITTYDYDPLGRVKKKTSPDGVATNTWDTAEHGVGKLAEARSADGVTIDHAYDELGRDATTTWTIEGTQYEIGHSYDDIGRLDTVSYPKIPGTENRLAVRYAYNAAGYLKQVSDSTGGTVYWRAEARNAAGQLQRESVNNGTVVTNHQYDVTGLLTRRYTDGPGTVGRMDDLTVGYDGNRNVTSRTETVSQRQEDYTYDTLNRLETWRLRQGTNIDNTSTYVYNTVGNLASETLTGRPDRADVTYGYGEDGAPPQALTSRNGQKYGYDAVGRQITGPQRTVAYSRAGLPTMLTWEGGGRTEYAYDADGARVLKRDAAQTVVYVPGYFERRTPAGANDREIHNISQIVVNGRTVAQVNHVQAASGGPVTDTRTWYLHTDQQGSTTLTSRSNGQLAAAYYDPFGQRVDAAGKPLDNSRRDGPRSGYTGHEHDDEYGLINMKGRIYDPEARRFLTPDPIQIPLSSQTHNRYSYVRNNPATLTDPTGFVWDFPTGGGTGPFNPDPFTGGTGPFNPESGCPLLVASGFPSCGGGPGWLGGLGGSLNATPTSSDAEPSPSSDDDTSSTADDDSASGVKTTEGEGQTCPLESAPECTADQPQRDSSKPEDPDDQTTDQLSHLAGSQADGNGALAAVTLSDLRLIGKIVWLVYNQVDMKAAESDQVAKGNSPDQRTNSGGKGPGDDNDDMPDPPKLQPGVPLTPVPEAAEPSENSEFWVVVGEGAAISAIALLAPEVLIFSFAL